MRTFVKKFLAVFLFFWIFFPAQALLQAQEVRPQDNPLCWDKKECEEKRAVLFGEDKAQGGWLEKEKPECDSEGWGKCLGVAATQAQISFGGSAKFLNAGEYIKAVYNYSLSIISILAVVVIIIAGAQWITSAGNAEVIGRAKKRITGAIIGLFIAFMSYAILETINPAMVKLRLPQIWLLRAIAIGEPPCAEQKNIDPGVTLTINPDFLEGYKKIKPNTSLNKDHKAKLLETQCGVVYDLPTGNKCRGYTCTGWLDAKDPSNTKKCGPGYPCACFRDAKSGQNFCTAASIGGVINMNGDQPIKDWYVDAMTVGALCGSESEGYFLISVDQLVTIDENDQEYAFAGLDANSDCGSSITLVGYFLVAEVNDFEDITSVDDDWIIGKNSCAPGAKPVVALANEGDIWTTLQQATTVGIGPAGKTYIENKDELESFLAKSGALWTKDDILSGATCDLITNVGPYNRGLSDSDFSGKFFITP